MKESLYSNTNKCVFRETFADEQVVRRNGGAVSNVVFENGVGVFSGINSIINGAKVSVNGKLFSVRVRFMVTGGAGTRRCVMEEKRDTTFFRMSAEISAVNTFRIFYGGGDTGVSTSIDLFTPVLNRWYEVVWTYDGTNIRGYHSGGNLVTSASAVSQTKGMILDLNIGDYRFGAGRPFNGKIELIEVYSVVLSAIQIARLFSNNNSYPIGSEVIALLGDKTGGTVVERSTTVNGVLANMSPDYIIGVGDFETNLLSISQLNVNLTSFAGRIFASPGNHDSALVAESINGGNGPRSDFNAFYGNGIVGLASYQVVHTKYVDFFIYDQFINEAETGYEYYGDRQSVPMSTLKTSTQGLWLINQMATSRAKFKVLVMHMAPYGSATPVGYMTGMQWDWKAYGIDMLICGHTHFYERLMIDTGSGVIPVVNIGNSGGAVTYPWTSVHAGSVFRMSPSTDASCSAGMAPFIIAEKNKLSLYVHAVADGGAVSEVKDKVFIVK